MLPLFLCMQPTASQPEQKSSCPCVRVCYSYCDFAVFEERVVRRVMLQVASEVEILGSKRTQATGGMDGTLQIDNLVVNLADAAPC